MEQDMDALVGTARREYRDAKKELDSLKAKAHKAGQVALKLHNALDNPADMGGLVVLR